jgi:predicted phosphodiesterase
MNMNRTKLLVILYFSLGIGLGALLPFPGDLSADSLSSLPDPDYSEGLSVLQTDPLTEKIRSIIYPVLGLPSICEAGKELRVMVDLADGGKTHDWVIELRTNGDPVCQTYPLILTSEAYDGQTGTYELRALIPASAPEDTYDLVLRSRSIARGTDRQPSCVKVTERIKGDFCFVHMCDNQLQDPLCQDPRLFGRVLEEIRLLHPEFVLLSGDLCYGMNYPQEYEENYAYLAKSGLPIYAVPGNHDGLASVIPTGNTPPDDPPGYLQRDGLYYWREYFGPTHYSFDYGEFHFICLNSMDGSQKRRNSITFLCENHGGELTQEQLDWLEWDAKLATKAGKEIILVLHHDPRGPIKPNIDAYPFPFVLRRGQQWNDAYSSQEILRIIAENNVSTVLRGHYHRDEYEEEVVNPGTPKERVVRHIMTTPPTMSAAGYRLIRVSGGKIVSYHYDGLSQQSVPVTNGSPGLEAAFASSNDGSAHANTAAVTNRLKDAMDVRLEFYLQPTRSGFRAHGGKILRVVTADMGESVIYLSATIPPGTSVDVTVEPDPSGHGVLPGSTASSSRLSGGGGGGGGCSFMGMHLGLSGNGLSNPGLSGAALSGPGSHSPLAGLFPFLLAFIPILFLRLLRHRQRV